jgi:hypothetical protein
MNLKGGRSSGSDECGASRGGQVAPFGAERIMNFPPPTSRQAQVIWFAMTALAVALTLGIVGAVIWGVGRVLLVLSPVLWPLAVAAIIAMILDPVVEWLGDARCHA